MNIDLTNLVIGVEEEILIDEKLEFSSEMFSGTLIRELKNIMFSGIICKEIIQMLSV